MTTHKLLLLPGDGIGPEVIAEVRKLVAWMIAHGMAPSNRGGVRRRSLDAHGVALTDETLAKQRLPTR